MDDPINIRTNAIKLMGTEGLNMAVKVSEQKGSVTPSVIVSCVVCNLPIDEFKNHNRKFHEHGYFCLLCTVSSVFRTFPAMKRHLASQHFAESHSLRSKYLRVHIAGLPMDMCKDSSFKVLTELCRVCNRLFDPNDIREHKKFAHDCAYVCKVCPFQVVYYTYQAAIHHATTLHNYCDWTAIFCKIASNNLKFLMPIIEETLTFKHEICVICDSQYDSLDKHNLEVHNYGFLCQLCDSSTVFLTGGLLKIHFETTHAENQLAWKNEESYVRVNTSSLPIHYTWSHKSHPKALEYCKACSRTYKKNIFKKHEAYAHTNAYVCKLCPNQPREVFYLKKVADNHLLEHHPNESTTAPFFFIQTGNLPFLFPVQIKMKKEKLQRCFVCNAENVNSNHKAEYHTTAKQCTVCGSGYFYNDLALCHPDADYTEVMTEHVPVTRICLLCNGLVIKDWINHIALFHEEENSETSDSLWPTSYSLAEDTQNNGYCHACNNYYPLLQDHLVEFHSNGYMCRLCDNGNIFLTFSAFEWHLEKCRKSEDRPPINIYHICVSTCSVPVSLLWIQETYEKDDFCPVCVRNYSNIDLHRQVAHDHAYICRICVNQEIYYVPHVAEAHSRAHETSVGNWELLFFILPTGNLPFLMPLPENWKDLCEMDIIFCEVCNVHGVDRNHLTKYHSIAKKCGKCESANFYDDEFEKHRVTCEEAEELQVNAENEPVSKTCKLCDRRCLDWMEHIELFHKVVVKTEIVDDVDVGVEEKVFLNHHDHTE